ncbi:hypothetical protein RJ640_008380 [Escallonia rubra]|uniref:PHL domain-containing protein n=1 Tax=Escallonia rubra TaxID=112253 RepID=A0AA88RI31_9ASTE|nr:hypothetical protein RJ640_008380 [Escallonia rubra]
MKYPLRKPGENSAQQLMRHLSGDSMTENFKDEKCKLPLSKSLVGGNMNVCKTRVLNFMQTERIPQGITTLSLGGAVAPGCDKVGRKYPAKKLGST